MLLGAAVAAVGAIGWLRDSGDARDASDVGESGDNRVAVTEGTGPADVPEPTEPAERAGDGDALGDPRTVVAELYDELEAAAAAGDVDALVERLHPAVIELYGEARCREFLGRFAQARPRFRVESASGPEPFDFERDGRTVPVGEALTARIVITVGDESTEPQEAHVAEAGGTPRWFTDCGEPVG